MYKIVFTKQALKDLEKLKTAGISKKAKELVDIIRKEGILSRRINIQHRLVYQVNEGHFVENETEFQGTIKIIRMWTHYDK